MLVLVLVHNRAYPQLSTYWIVQPRGGQAQIRGNMPIPSGGTTFSHNIKEW
jgi:hypothetical protein